MKLADKIIRLRKRNGWSQEELANKMNVSRQAVSKWESAQTIPDLEKILQLGALFSVSTDYLLKDEIEVEELIGDSYEHTVKQITVNEAKVYLEQRKRASWQIAIATFLCIISPITLILLGVATETPGLEVSEKTMGIVGLASLFIFVSAAVPIYIYCGFKNEQYAFLDKNIPFKLEHGVLDFLTDRQRKFRNLYVRCNIIATTLCIFSPVPLIVSAFSENNMLIATMLALMLIIVGVGVSIFIIVGVRNASIQKLLREGEYTDRKKAKSGLREVVGFAYWAVITTVYLIWSIGLNDWDISWIVFAAGGILFPAMMYICNYISDKQNKA